MAPAPRSLSGKVVVVTGGARGIGRATAAALYHKGARVAIGDLDASLTARAAEEIGSDCLGLPLDVTDVDIFGAFLDGVEAQIGPIDALVNNAGVFLVSMFADEDPVATARMVDVNIGGAMSGTRLALQRMMPRGRGHIVNVASVAGKAAFPGAATYTATKFAIIGLSEAVRVEARPSGIDVSCILPGLVDTEMAAGLALPPGIRPIKPENVAGAIVSALERPRFEVYVPRAFGVMVGVNGLMPRAVRERLGHLAKADVPLTADRTVRAGYADRVQRDAASTGATS